MLHSMPILRILPVENLFLHENHDPSRTVSLKEHLVLDGFLRNPPVVFPLEDGASQYIVLDGANRTSAFKALNIPHIIAQVVESQTKFSLKTWNHILMDTDTDKFIACIQNIPHLILRPFQDSLVIDNGDTEELAKVFLSTGEIFTLSVPGDNFIDSIDALNCFERTCQENGIVERSSMTSLDILAQTYPNFSALVIYQAAKFGTVLRSVKSGKLLPAGITRFLISPRVLRVNYPIEELGTSESLAAKNDTLQAWIQCRITERGIRCYEESTIMFDE